MGEKIIGIYCWINKSNNKRYIGASNNIYRRWIQHGYVSNRLKNRKFYSAINEFGINNFNKIILEEFELYDKNQLKKREKYYIDYYNTIDDGYNTENGYNNINDNSDIEKIKIVLSNKAKRRRWINNGEKQKTVDVDLIEEYLNNGWVKGRLKFTNEHIENLSKSHIGYSPTKETRKKLSKLWEGRNHTKETKDMMSKKLQGRYSLDWYISKYGEKLGKEKHFNHHNKSTIHNKNKICVNNGEINRMIPKNELSLYLEQNWSKGRIKNK